MEHTGHPQSAKPLPTDLPPTHLTSADSEKSESPKMAARQVAPSTTPKVANARGSAMMPAPMIVVARLAVA